MNKDYENGYQIVQLTDEELAAFYGGKGLNFALYENEYLAIANHNGDVVDKYCFQNGALRKLKYSTIRAATGDTIKPRNLQQEFAIDMLNDRTTPFKILRGTYGSGRLFATI